MTTYNETTAGRNIRCNDTDLFCDNQDYYCDGSVVHRNPAFTSTSYSLIDHQSFWPILAEDGTEILSEDGTSILPEEKTMYNDITYT